MTLPIEHVYHTGSGDARAEAMHARLTTGAAAPTRVAGYFCQGTCPGRRAASPHSYRACAASLPVADSTPGSRCRPECSCHRSVDEVAHHHAIQTPGEEDGSRLDRQEIEARGAGISVSHVAIKFLGAATEPTCLITSCMAAQHSHDPLGLVHVRSLTSAASPPQPHLRSLTSAASPCRNRTVSTLETMTWQR
jgi:hypothetical protein